MKTLQDGLPPDAQEKLLSNKKVTEVVSGPDGVKVTCADGTSYEGTLVVGADGAHSTVRKLMRNAAIQAPPTVHKNVVNEANPFLTTYRAMWIRFPTVLPIKAGDASETHGYQCTLQLFAGEDTSVVGLYERLDAPTREGVRYTEADEEEFVKRWGHLPIVSGLKVGDVYANRSQSGMVNLEEGVVKYWSFDRIVLVGDAAHKFTPSTGAGCNNGIVDVVALANELYHAFKTVRSNDPEAYPTKEHVFAAFDAYQLARFDAIQEGLSTASLATGAATWSDASHKFVDKHILSRQSLQKFFVTRQAPKLARTPVFEYVEGKEDFAGKFPWLYSVKSTLPK